MCMCLSVCKCYHVVARGSVRRHGREDVCRRGRSDDLRELHKDKRRRGGGKRERGTTRHVAVGRVERQGARGVGVGC